MLLILAFLGGALGAITRESIVLLSPAMDNGFPLGVFIANSVGSFLLGVVAGHYKKNVISHELNHFLGVGIIGGMTTFSTFVGDALQGLTQGRLAMPLLYLLLSITVGYFAVWAGVQVTHRRLIQKSKAA